MKIRDQLSSQWSAFREKSPGQMASESLWWIFLIWSTVGLFIMATGLSEQTIVDWKLEPVWTRAALACLHWGDFLYLLFGALVVGSTAAQVLSPRDLRTAVLVITVGSGLVETIGTLTGFPFGSYTYMNRLGPQIGPLPLAIPTAWWLVVAGFYLTARRLFPTLNRRNLSLITAAAATGFDWIMEPFAWEVRGYWIWHDGAVPVENYAAWFALSFILARLAPLHAVAPWKTDLRAGGVIILTLLLFLIGRLAA
jgi:uncharacterized membrane protein